MSKIIGNTTATPNPRPDWAQTDSNKADYIKNKPNIENGEGKHSLIQTNTYILEEGDTPVNGTWQNQAKGVDSLAFGLGSLAEGKRSVAIGNQNTSLGNTSIVMGQVLKATKTSNASLLTGNGNIAENSYSVTAGYNNRNLGCGTAIFGMANHVGHYSEDGTGDITGEESGAELNSYFRCNIIGGSYNKLYGKDSAGNIISGSINQGENIGNTILIGSSNSVLNAHDSAIFGQGNSIDSSSYVLVSGGKNAVSNSCSGSGFFGNNNTITTSANSLVAGSGHTVSGDNRYIFGEGNTAPSQYGKNIFLFGSGLTAVSGNQFILGKYNALNKGGVLIIGNGTNDETRATTYVINSDGSTWQAGDLIVDNDAEIAGKLTAKGLALNGNATIDGGLVINGTGANGLSVPNNRITCNGLTSNGSALLNAGASINGKTSITGDLSVAFWVSGAGVSAGGSGIKLSNNNFAVDGSGNTTIKGTCSVETAPTQDSHVVRKLELDKLEKRFGLLEEKTICAQQVTDTYEMQVTANGAEIVDGLPTTVMKIEGDTVKDNLENLLTTPYFDVSSKTVTGITFTPNDDGSITINGTNTATALYECNFMLAKTNLANGVYYGNESFGVDGVELHNISGYEDKTYMGEFTAEYGEYEKQIAIVVLPNTTVNNLTIYPYISKTPKLFNGLKNAQISGIKSTGKNLIPYPYPESGNIFVLNYISVDNQGIITINGTSTNSWVTFQDNLTNLIPNKKYNISGCPSGGSSDTYYLFLQCYDKDGNQITMKSGSGYDINAAGDYGNGNGYTFIVPEDYHHHKIAMFVKAGSTFNNVVFKPMLRMGETALPFEPYIENTMQLPQVEELGKWDYIEGDKLVKNTKILTFDGTENWKLHSSGYYFTIEDSTIPKGIDMGPGISTHYEYKHSYHDDYHVFVSGSVYVSSPLTASFDNDVEKWKTHLANLYANGTPLTIAYETAKPVETIDLDFDNQYKAYYKGSETLVVPKDDNDKTCFDYGANIAITQEYYFWVGGAE